MSYTKFDPILASQLFLATCFDLPRGKALMSALLRSDDQKALDNALKDNDQKEIEKIRDTLSISSSDTKPHVPGTPNDDFRVINTPDHIVVAFRSGDSDNDAREYAQAYDAKQISTPIGGQHEGYWHVLHDEADGHPSMLEKLTEILDHSQKPILITGMSRGGGLATLFATEYAEHERALNKPSRIEALYTFGQPMVGDEVYAQNVRKLLGDRYLRVKMTNDPVPLLPPPNLGYVHAVDPVQVDNVVDNLLKQVIHNVPELHDMCISRGPEHNSAEVLQERDTLWQDSLKAVKNLFGHNGFIAQVEAGLKYPDIASHYLYPVALIELEHGEVNSKILPCPANIPDNMIVSKDSPSTRIR